MRSHNTAGSSWNTKTITNIYGLYPPHKGYLAEISEPLRPLLPTANTEAQNKLDWKKFRSHSLTKSCKDNIYHRKQTL